MCGRFTLRTPLNLLMEQFQLASVPPLPARFNIAPTQQVPVVRQLAADLAPQLDLLYWGLIPSWAKDPAIGNKLINARGETVAEKPSFRSAYRQRRCLIVADGFYEWQKLAGGKQPYYIEMRDHGPFAFAGLWESWRDKTLKESPVIESCTIITTEANAVLSELHDRMPVIIPPENYALWLDPAISDRTQLDPRLGPYPAEPMHAYPVSTLVNRPSNDLPACIAPVQGSLF